MKPEIEIGGRKIGEEFAPFIIAEIGINHEGDIVKAKRMIDAAASAGCECVKFQCHVIDDEFSSQAKKMIPENYDQPTWKIITTSALC